MRRMTWRVVMGAVLVMSFLVTGCNSMKAKPSQGAGFVPLSEMPNRPDLPFHNAWVRPDVDWKPYKTIYIKGINTQYLLEANWWQQSVRREDMASDVREIGLYMQNKFKEAFQNDPKHRFKVVSKPEPGSITLEMALTELVPSHPLMEALSIVAPSGSGVAVQAATTESGAKCTVAFEARIIDTTTGHYLAMVADREQGKMALINLSALTWYGEARTIIDEWSEQFVQIANKRPGEVIKDSSAFTLKPW